MKRLLPLFILSSFLFGQDVLLHKSGKNYKGRYITKENEVIIFRVEGEKDSRMFLINDVDIIISNREGAKVELYYPFDLITNIEKAFSEGRFELKFEDSIDKKQIKEVHWFIPLLIFAIIAVL